MAKRQTDEGPVTDENQTPAEYDEAAVKAQEDAIAKRQAQDPEKYEPAPEGGLFDGEDPLEDRAEEARRKQKETPVIDHSGGPPSPVEVITARERNKLRLDEQPEDYEDPFLQPRVPSLQEKEVKYPLMAVIFYGGRFRLYGFTSFDYMRGWIQKEKGTKRIFRYTGEVEWQEIKATGESVIR